MKKKGSTFILVITVMLFAVAMTLAVLAVYMKSSGYVITRQETRNEEDPHRDFDKLVDIDEIIRDTYLNEYNRETAIEDVYRALVGSLNDPYSRYLDSKELEQLQQGINSSYTGTGIVFIENDTGEGFLITEVVSGGPADSIGIKDGDIIIAVDDKIPADVEKVAESLKGDPGTTVKIKVLRDGVETEFSLVRGEIQGASIESAALDSDNLGYIKIKSFGEDTAGQFDAAISSFERDKVDGVVIDLRNNPGGIFETGIEIADKLLSEGLITYTMDNAGERIDYNSDTKRTKLPFIILINENTASTGEMVAAASKASGSGTVIGTKSYGKGLIQETHFFSDGTAVSITVKEFFAPDGGKIDGEGVKPDITVRESTNADKDTQLERAISELKKR